MRYHQHGTLERVAVAGRLGADGHRWVPWCSASPFLRADPSLHTRYHSAPGRDIPWAGGRSTAILQLAGAGAV